MSEVTIVIRLEVSPAIEKLIEVLATAQYQYDDIDDIDENAPDEDPE
jgi:hypothetical protein